MIDRDTGALVLSTGRIERGLEREAWLASPIGADRHGDDLHNGWMWFTLAPITEAGLRFSASLAFEGEALDGYRLSLSDARYGTSWDDWSEQGERARRDAHDSLLIAWLGAGERAPSPQGPELRYDFPWGEVWSTFDMRGGSSSIGVRFRRLGPSA
ncbi:MAG: hypothetical protein NVSMB47_20280 [Polyangiales bacterium]